ncbi:MAG: aconitate hydratase AcnA [Bdellovibrionaceae bacterium]|nr:aconitate hydratase AcnA [Pseudobdellovibrionaceae bacterium]
MNPKTNSYETATELSTQGKTLQYHSLPAFEKKTGTNLSKLPFSLKILLENVLRNEDGIAVTAEQAKSIAHWDPKASPKDEIQFTPARILLQDFTGVPAVADLAAMRGAVKRLGGDPTRINPLQPADLVIDHSVQVDYFGNSEALKKNTDIEFKRNKERYEFLRWGQTAFKNFRVVPPNTGIVHQVNLEYLSHVAMIGKRGETNQIYPDTLVGTDSHTTMINGLGVLGWGVGGIEAEAAMLGQPVTMLIPQVVGFKLTGTPAPGTTATDLVLTVVEMLRAKGVVGKFVEFYGPGLANLSLADRATIANMAPEYGATCGLFPIDERTTEYLKLTGRTEKAEEVRDYYKAQGMWFDENSSEATYSDTLSLDLSTVVPCLAGPKRPQDRINLDQMDKKFTEVLPSLIKGEPKDVNASISVTDEQGQSYEIQHGSVVIAAITSCTNTSNPSVLMAAGLVAQKAAAKGLQTKPWVKTSLAPGSKVVTDYLKKAGLLESLEALRFNTVGYGCTTCIGNSGPLPSHIQKGIEEKKLVAASVLSGNRNFEGRISPHVRANYLASPPLVVAYAIAGTVQIDLSKDPIGKDTDGKDVFLKDIWPTQEEIQKLVNEHVTSQQFQSSYQDVFAGPQEWQAIDFPKDDLYKWKTESTCIKEPPFFQEMTLKTEPMKNVEKARVLALLEDSVTTDHISPAGAFTADSPAGTYLVSQNVDPKDFNSFGSRRGNHEVMMRGTFGNVRLRNLLAPGTEGGFTQYQPSGQPMTIFDASMEYQKNKTELVILAGKEYGTGSSRDWAAKGTNLLGVKAVIASSFERIHRSNLVGMGVLPLQFKEGESWKSLGLTGKETYDITGVDSLSPQDTLSVTATAEDGSQKTFEVISRIDTPNEIEYYKNGGILQYVLRQIVSGSSNG